MTWCPQCGSTDLVGGRYFRLLAHFTATLPCRCGLGANGVAAVRRFRRPTLLEEWGRSTPTVGERPPRSRRTGRARRSRWGPR